MKTDGPLTAGPVVGVVVAREDAFVIADFSTPPAPSRSSNRVCIIKPANLPLAPTIRREGCDFNVPACCVGTGRDRDNVHLTYYSS